MLSRKHRITAGLSALLLGAAGGLTACDGMDDPDRPAPPDEDVAPPMHEQDDPMQPGQPPEDPTPPGSDQGAPGY